MKTVNTYIKIPAGIHAKIKRLAEANRRSMTAQVLLMLERQLEAGE